MKRFFSLAFILVLIAGAVFAWMSLSTGTDFTEKNKYILVEKGATDKTAVLDLLEKKHIIKYRTAFSLLGSALGMWDKLQPGKYEVKKGESLLTLARTLKNNRQAQLNLVINRLRTKEDLAKLISKNFISDSTAVMNFLNSNDSLQSFGVDTSTVFTMIIPNTYTFYWNTPLRKMFSKFAEGSTAFWNKNNRKGKAAETGFSPEQVYILSSIVEEETNRNSDKGNIASVYINRLNKGMPLQSDPTIKYSMKDFSINRIYFKYLSTPSPYNTYLHKGLPPGPICIPSPVTIDEVLNAPKTDYLFFVGTSDLGSDLHFSNNFAEHSQYAKEYQKALDAYMAKKQNQPQQ